MRAKTAYREGELRGVGDDADFRLLNGRLHELWRAFRA
jgi:hypothetical protein